VVDPLGSARVGFGRVSAPPGAVARLLGLGDDDTGTAAWGPVHAIFTGLLVQSLLSEGLVIDGDQVMAALLRITERLGAI
jgi:hypothetical protein